MKENKLKIKVFDCYQEPIINFTGSTKKFKSVLEELEDKFQ